MESVNLYYAVSAFVFLAALLGVGYWLSLRQRTDSTHDFAVASRQMSAPRMVLMNIATYLSAVSLIGFTGYGYTSGFALLAFFFGTILGHLPLALVSRRLHSWHVSSIAEFVGQRYRSTLLRAWFGLVFIVIYTVYLMLNLVGVGVLLHSVAGLPIWLSELGVLLALMAYVALGGMRVTSLINSVQAVVIMTVVMGGAVLAFVAAGGFGSLFDQVKAIDSTLLSATNNGELTPGILLGTTLGWMSGVACRADFGAQALSGSRARVAGWTLGLPAIVIVVVYLGLQVIGLSVRTHLPHLDNSDAAFPLFFSEVAPDWTGWFMIFALLSGITAACDSYILTISSIVSNDIVKPIMSRLRVEQERVERVSVNAARLTVLAASIVAFAVSLTDLPVLALATLSLFIVWGATCFIPIYGGLLWRRPGHMAAFLSSLVGGVLAVVWLVVPPVGSSRDAALVGLLGSLVAYLGVSLFIERLRRRPVAEAVSGSVATSSGGTSLPDA